MACALFLVTSTAWAADAAALKTEKDRLSYSIGASIGKNLKTESADIDVNVMIEALKANLAGDKMLLSDKEVRQIMGDYQTKLRQRAVLKKQRDAAENKKLGDAYLARYKGQPGVHELPEGVLYRVIKEGSGKRPVSTDTVEVNYRGALITGTEFDATESGKPASLTVSTLIPGWKQALTAMPTGAKWQIVIPSALAYGERGVGSDIGPNEVLVFELELVAIK
jgi:FKBP-type peptidyl-prolyl cis-trans isomerase FklB